MGKITKKEVRSNVRLSLDQIVIVHGIEEPSKKLKKLLDVQTHKLVTQLLADIKKSSKKSAKRIVSKRKKEKKVSSKSKKDKTD